MRRQFRSKPLFSDILLSSTEPPDGIKGSFEYGQRAVCGFRCVIANKVFLRCRTPEDAISRWLRRRWFSELQVAIRVHGNAVEYVPIGLILLLFMEMNGAQTWMVHVCGILLIVGRLMHSYGFHHRLYRWRRSGMSATWCSLLLMVLANFWYMPWELVFSVR